MTETESVSYERRRAKSERDPREKLKESKREGDRRKEKVEREQEREKYKERGIEARKAEREDRVKRAKHGLADSVKRTKREWSIICIELVTASVPCSASSVVEMSMLPPSAVPSETSTPM